MNRFRILEKREQFRGPREGKISDKNGKGIFTLKIIGKRGLREGIFENFEKP